MILRTIQDLLHHQPREKRCGPGQQLFIDALDVALPGADNAGFLGRRRVHRARRDPRRLTQHFLVSMVGILAAGCIKQREGGRHRLFDECFALAGRVRLTDHVAGDERIVDAVPCEPGVREGELASWPELAWPEIHHRLDHIHRGRVGRRLGPAGLAHHHVDLGKPAQHHVARLQIVKRFGHRCTRHRDRHVHHHPFIERRHELALERLHRLVGNECHR